MTLTSNLEQSWLGWLGCFQTTYQLNKLVMVHMAAKQILARNYMFKVNNRNTKTRCEICSKLTLKTTR